MGTLRSPHAAGRFYPADPAELRAVVDRLLAETAGDEPPEGVAGVLVPHAGYPYSGRLAARGFNALRGTEFSTAVILGTAHTVRERGLAIDDSTAWKTPLGEVAVDRDLAEALVRSHPDAVYSHAAHAREHSVEVQVPFLQRLRPSAKILPVVTSVDDPRAAEGLGRALAAVMGKKGRVLLLSTDLSHYPSAADARRVDPAALRAVCSVDAGFLVRAAAAIEEAPLANLDCAFCGRGAAMAALSAFSALGAGRADELDCADSGMVTGDLGRVVGYGAAAFLPGKRTGPFFGLGPEDKAELAALARGSLLSYFSTGAMPEERVFDRPLLNLPGGVFVTWTRPGPGGEESLRGCVGTVHADRSIGNAVLRYAILSATGDPRMAPVALEELSELVCEVSVLSPPRPATLGEIRPGLGVILEKGSQSGLFLPVMWEHLPQKEKFLEVLAAQKARLPRGGWRDPAVRWRVFEAEVCEEEDR